MSHYPYSYQQDEKISRSPRISGSFALDKGLWDGRDVAVVAISRGTHHRRTQRAIYYGTLVLAAGNADQVGVRDAKTGEVDLIHRSRAVDVYDLTRKAGK